MCGRFTLDPTTKFYERFEISNRLDELTSRYNIAPGQLVPVITKNSPNRVEMMKWGLIPHWAKEAKIGYKMINARAETLAEKPTFRNLIKNQRCLIPASGFYEWKKTEKGKIPYYIHEKKEPLFAFAGLYDFWKSPEGAEIKSFTIITTSPNEVMKNIHDRMPVILKRADEEKWLIAQPEEALKFLIPSKLPLEAYTVSARVNTPKFNDKGLIQLSD